MGLRYVQFDGDAIRPSMTTMTVRKLPHPVWQYAIPAAIAVVCGVLIGVMVTRGGGGSSKKSLQQAATSAPPVSTPVAVAVSAPVVTVSPLVVAPTAPTANVTFETTPRGATVTLIDNGKPAYVGTTPVEATLDSTHRYDVVYTMDGYRTRVTALDPSTTRRAEARMDLVRDGKPHPDRRASTQRQRRHR